MKKFVLYYYLLSSTLFAHSLRHYPDAPLDIITVGHPTLTMIAKEVTDDEILSSSFQVLIDDMILTMKKANGVGLAAPQVNVSKRFFVMKPSLFKKAEVVINPVLEYLTQYGKKKSTESCLSIPGKSYKVSRYKKLNVTYKDRNGKRVSERASGFRAIVIQHEYDHLNGNLISDIFLKSFQFDDDFNFQIPLM